MQRTVGSKHEVRIARPELRADRLHQFAHTAQRDLVGVVMDAQLGRLAVPANDVRFLDAGAAGQCVRQARHAPIFGIVDPAQHQWQVET